MLTTGFKEKRPCGDVFLGNKVRLRSLLLRSLSLCSFSLWSGLLLCCLLFLCHCFVPRYLGKLLVTSVAEKIYENYSAVILIIVRTQCTYNSINVLCVDNFQLRRIFNLEFLISVFFFKNKIP